MFGSGFPILNQNGPDLSFPILNESCQESARIAGFEDTILSLDGFMIVSEAATGRHRRAQAATGGQTFWH